jgi:hypothetical protein
MDAGRLCFARQQQKFVDLLSEKPDVFAEN